MKIYQIIGDNIRGFRTKIGWTQEKLAVRTKLSNTYIGNIERAENKITIDALSKISKVLNKELYLFFIEGAYSKTTHE